MNIIALAGLSSFWQVAWPIAVVVAYFAVAFLSYRWLVLEDIRHNCEPDGNLAFAAAWPFYWAFYFFSTFEDRTEDWARAKVKAERERAKRDEQLMEDKRKSEERARQELERELG